MNYIDRPKWGGGGRRPHSFQVWGEQVSPTAPPRFPRPCMTVLKMYAYCLVGEKKNNIR